MTALGVVRVCVLACPPEHPVIVQTLQCGVDRSDTAQFICGSGFTVHSGVDRSVTVQFVSGSDLQCGMDRPGTVHSSDFTVGCG